MKLDRVTRQLLGSILLSVTLLSLNKGFAKEFILGVEAVSYYPLFDFSTNDVSKPSFTKELLSQFFESHNYQYRFLPLPIKRFDKWFTEEGIDFKFPDNVRWRESNPLNIVYSEPVVKLMAGAFVLKKNADMPRDKVRKLGTILGFVPTLWIEEINRGDVVLMEEYSPLSVVKHLLYGNVEATNIDENVIRFNLAQLDREGEIVLNKAIKHEVFAYHLSSVKYPEIIKEFNQYLRENKEAIEQLKKKYHIK